MTYSVEPLTPLRKIIAARMTEAKQTIPHFRVISEVEADRLLSLRAQLNAESAESKVSINDLIVRACAVVLMQRPEMNIQWAGTAVHRMKQADISLIVGLDGGLSMPVIRAAETKSVRDIAREARALAGRAAAGSLRMEEITGGSFTISNLGMHGVEQFDAIVNPPQCAILAVGAAAPAVRARTDGSTYVAQLMRLTLSVDHRAIDGAMAGRFLGLLKATLQRPELLLLPESA